MKGDAPKITGPVVYTQSVVCPVPDCPWKASATVEHDPLYSLRGWQDGVFRDALNAERVEHVRQHHLLIELGT